MTHSAGLGYGLTTTNPVDRMYRRDTGPRPDGLARPKMVGHKSEGSRCSPSPARGGRPASRVDVQGYIVEKVSGPPFRCLSEGSGSSTRLA